MFLKRSTKIAILKISYVNMKGISKELNMRMSYPNMKKVESY